MKPLRTLHIDSEKGWGGGQLQLAGLCTYLKQRGHEVKIVCSPGSKVASWAADNGFGYETIAMKSILDLASVLKLKNIMAREQPDIVHLHTSKAHVLGSAAAKLAGAQAIVATRHMQHPINMIWPNTSAYGNWTSALVAISQTVRDAMVKSGIHASKIHLIESGANVESFANASPDPELRAFLGIDKGTPLIFTACSLVAGKGVEYLLEAVAMLKRNDIHVHVLIAGDGEKRLELEKLAAKLEVSASFAGFRNNISTLMTSIDIFVMPSESEGLGIAAVEAMAAGKPVIASAVGGLRESVLDGETGYLVPPRNPAAISESIEKLLSSPAIASKFGKNGRTRACEKYSLTNMAMKNEALYYEMLGE